MELNCLMTPKQNDIFRQLIQGKTYEEIGEICFISKETVKDHCRLIYKQYGVENRNKLMAKLLKNKYKEI